VRLSDNRAAAGEQAATYLLSIRALAETAETGVVVIVAGKNKEDDALQSNIYHVTNAAYQLFQANGYDDNNILYLASDTFLDADGDGDNDVDAGSTKASLQSAITTIAPGLLGGGDPFTLYMMDHGGYDLFYLNLIGDRSESVSAYELDQWLDQLQSKVNGVTINVIIEACHSGSFIDLPQALSGPDRVIVASTGAYPLAYASEQGAVFSDAFIDALGRGMSLYSGFEEARWAARQAHPDQTPWLDDNGDGVPNDPQDGQVAARRGFAYAGTLTGEDWPPYIADARVQRTSGTIQAQVLVHSSKTISEVWALIYAPSYEPPAPGEDMIIDDVPRVTLVETQQGGDFVATYDFTEQGSYRVVVNAMDDTGKTARPREAKGGETHAVFLPMSIKQ
jgi:hypothetical protein